MAEIFGARGIMNCERNLLMSGICVLLLVLLTGMGSAQEKGHNRQSVCSAPHPESICSTSNTCGSSSTPCTVDVKRTAASAASIASVADAKANTAFCVKSGTKVTWQSLSKETGFVIDFGSSSPFEPSGAILGGYDRSKTVVAKSPGCFKYLTGACVSGATYGMCDSVESDLIVVSEAD
jgi:hypothetical protein